MMSKKIIVIFTLINSFFIHSMEQQDPIQYEIIHLNSMEIVKKFAGSVIAYTSSHEPFATTNGFTLNNPEWVYAYIDKYPCPTGELTFSMHRIIKVKALPNICFLDSKNLRKKPVLIRTITREEKNKISHALKNKTAELEYVSDDIVLPLLKSQ